MSNKNPNDKFQITKSPLIPIRQLPDGNAIGSKVKLCNQVRPQENLGNKKAKKE